MRYFEDRAEVDEWLEPLTYAQFWEEVEIFNLDLPSREECDADIAEAGAAQDTVLFVLKGMARLQIVKQQELPSRITVPWISLH